MEPVQHGDKGPGRGSLRSFLAGGVIGLLGLSPLAAMAADPTPVPEPTPTVTFTVDPSPTDSVTPTPIPTPTVNPSPSPSPSQTPYPETPPRPHGESGLRATFGKHCGPKANDARAYFPNAWGRGKHGYVYTHWKLGKVMSEGILGSIVADRKDQAVDYGVWGYACRAKTGGTSWSVHSWGVAIDTNTLRNPYGQTWWDGKGANGKRYGRYLPNLWMSRNFYWGLNFNDPMHFQYVTGY